MTRARNRLFLAEAEGRGHEGAPRYPSRFLLDIDPAALEFSNKPAERELDDARAAYALADRWIADLVRDARFAVGDRMTHAAFGSGRVLAVDSRSAPTRWRSTIWTRRAPSRSKPSSSKPDEPLPLCAPSRSASERSRHTRFASCAASSRACLCTRAPGFPARRSASCAWCQHPFRCSHSLFCKMFHVKHSFADRPGGARARYRGRVAPAAGCPRRLSARRAAASAPPALVFGPVLQVFRTRGKQLPEDRLIHQAF